MRSLFQMAPTAKVTPAKVAIASGAVVAGTVLSLLRTTGPGALDTILVEDGTLFLPDALRKGFWVSMSESYSGYYHLVPRVLAQITALFPAGWAAAVISVQAALVTSLLALVVYTASAGLLPTKLQRILVSAPLIVLPLAQYELYNSVAMLRWPLMYATFWAILWVSPSRAGQIVGPVVIGLSAFSDNVVWMFGPLLLYRLWILKRQDMSGWVSLGLLSAGTLINLGVVITGATTRNVEPRLDPIWAAGAYLVRPVPQLLVGANWVTYRPEHTLTGLLPVFAGWLIAGVIVVLALKKVTRPHWQLAIVAMFFSVAVYAFCVMVVGVAMPRYGAPAALLALTALVALLTPTERTKSARQMVPGKAYGADVYAFGTRGDEQRSQGPFDGRSRAPLLAFAGLMLVVCAVNLHGHNSRSFGPSWSEELAKARAACAQDPTKIIPMQVSPKELIWKAELPCTYLQR